MRHLRFLPDDTHIDFIGWRYYAFAADGLLMLIAIVSIAIQGFNLGIDFSGGVLLETKSAYTIDVGKVRALVDTLGFGQSQIQTIGGGECDKPAGSCVQIRVQQPANKPGQAVVNSIKAKLGGAYTFRRVEVVGPSVSHELFNDGVMATVLAIVFISLWVAFRFEWQYGVGALIATGHDVLVTAGLFSVLHMEFSINSVAALLLLAGYSINDTVVVFDRIRENRRKFKRIGNGGADQSLDQPDRDAYHAGVVRHGADDVSAVVLRRSRALRVQRVDPVRHCGRHILVDLCRRSAAALSPARRRPSRRR